MDIRTSTGVFISPIRFTRETIDLVVVKHTPLYGIKITFGFTSNEARRNKTQFLDLPYQKWTDLIHYKDVLTIYKTVSTRLQCKSQQTLKRQIIYPTRREIGNGPPASKKLTFLSRFIIKLNGLSRTQCHPGPPSGRIKSMNYSRVLHARLPAVFFLPLHDPIWTNIWY